MYWSDNDRLIFPVSDFKVAPGDTLMISYQLPLEGLNGLRQTEVRLVDDAEIVLHGFVITGRFQNPDTLAIDSYRNEFFPFKVKEQVFNLGMGFNHQILSKEFVLYNFGGDSLDLEGAISEDERFNFEFHPPKIAHNQFTRVKISFDPNSDDLGFERKNVKVFSADEDLIALVPIQYTLEAYTASASGPHGQLAVSKANHDFKVVKKGDIKQTSVIISNVGSDNLIIKKVESNCPCLTYQLEQTEIAPGSSTTMRVTFNAKDRVGYEVKTLALFSNDPGRSTRVITFKAHVK